MALQQDITADQRIFLGEDKYLEFPVYDQTNLTDEELRAQIAAGTATPIDVSGWGLLWVLRKKDKSDDPALIEKSTGSPADITVIGTWDANQGTNTQRVRVALYDTDSYDPTGSPPVILRKGTYRHSLKRMDDGSESVLNFGKFVFLQSTTR